MQINTVKHNISQDILRKQSQLKSAKFGARILFNWIGKGDLLIGLKHLRVGV